MLKLSVQASSAELEKTLKRLSNGVRDLRPVLDAIGQELESRISARFETETDPDGQAWAAWSHATEASYPRKGAHGRILDRYGDMLRSLSHEADNASVRIAFGAVAGDAKDVYAAYHEYGTETMPRRGLLMSDPHAGTLGEGDERAVLDILEQHLEGLMR